jgi:hypothetical protein
MIEIHRNRDLDEWADARCFQGNINGEIQIAMQKDRNRRAIRRAWEHEHELEAIQKNERIHQAPLCTVT